MQKIRALSRGLSCFNLQASPPSLIKNALAMLHSIVWSLGALSWLKRISLLASSSPTNQLVHSGTYRSSVWFSTGSPQLPLYIRKKQVNLHLKKRFSNKVTQFWLIHLSVEFQNVFLDRTKNINRRKPMFPRVSAEDYIRALKAQTREWYKNKEREDREREDANRERQRHSTLHSHYEGSGSCH